MRLYRGECTEYIEGFSITRWLVSLMRQPPSMYLENHLTNF